jgi:hypothetical protein
MNWDRIRVTGGRPHCVRVRQHKDANRASEGHSLFRIEEY